MKLDLPEEQRPLPSQPYFYQDPSDHTLNYFESSALRDEAAQTRLDELQADGWSDTILAQLITGTLTGVSVAREGKFRLSEVIKPSGVIGDHGKYKHNGPFSEVPEGSVFYTWRDSSEAESIKFQKHAYAPHEHTDAQYYGYSPEFGDQTFDPNQPCWWYEEV